MLNASLALVSCLYNSMYATSLFDEKVLTLLPTNPSGFVSHMSKLIKRQNKNVMNFHCLKSVGWRVV